jgi:ferredoxin
VVAPRGRRPHGPPDFEEIHRLTYIITEPCIGVKDTACVDVCPVDCIYGKDEDWEMLFIHPEQCIDCGLCVDACPVEAIFPLAEVPAKWRAFIARNYEQFGFTPP